MRTPRFGLVVLIVCLTAHISWAQPKLTLGLRLQDTNNQDLPNDDGHYEMSPGEEFRVVLNASVSNANWTDGYHTDSTHQALAPIELGIANLAVNITSTGTSGMLSPLAEPRARGPSRWMLNATDPAETLAQPSSVAYPWVNLVDPDHDGDLDPSGAGIAVLNLAWSGNSSSLLSLQNGIGDQTDIMRGGYMVESHGTSILSLTSIAATYYYDPSPATNTLGADYFNAADITVQPITITAPEPASTVLTALASFVVLTMRRRKSL